MGRIAKQCFDSHDSIIDNCIGGFCNGQSIQFHIDNLLQSIRVKNSRVIFSLKNKNDGRNRDKRNGCQ